MKFKLRFQYRKWMERHETFGRWENGRRSEYSTAWVQISKRRLHNGVIRFESATIPFGNEELRRIRHFTFGFWMIVSMTDINKFNLRMRVRQSYQMWMFLCFEFRESDFFWHQTSRPWKSPILPNDDRSRVWVITFPWKSLNPFTMIGNRLFWGLAGMHRLCHNSPWVGPTGGLDNISSSWNSNEKPSM
jgi:hypothetical protein